MSLYRYPIGCIVEKPWWKNRVDLFRHEEWKECLGQALSRNEHKILFDKIGNIYAPNSQQLSLFSEDDIFYLPNKGKDFLIKVK